MSRLPVTDMANIPVHDFILQLWKLATGHERRPGISVEEIVTEADKRNASAVVLGFDAWLPY